MKKFEKLEISLQKQIINVCENDPYNLDPKTLYKYIFKSKGKIQVISKALKVHETLIIKIKEEGKTKNENK